MTTTTFLIVIGIITLLILVFVYNLSACSLCKWCQHCVTKLPESGKCPKCPESAPVVSHPSANKAEVQTLLALARGTLHRLRGVVRENIATKSEIKNFVNSGDNRLVIVTDIVPEAFVSSIMDGKNPTLDKVKAVAISCAVVNGTKQYIVLKLLGGKLTPQGTPSSDFDNAFEMLEKLARMTVGDDTNNLVFLIDEDVPVSHDKIVPPVLDPAEGSNKEKCCGARRW
jgi:hypothetical protein